MNLLSEKMNLSNQNVSVTSYERKTSCIHPTEALFNNDLIAIAHFDVNLKLQKVSEQFLAILDIPHIHFKGLNILDLNLENKISFSKQINQLANGELKSCTFTSNYKSNWEGTKSTKIIDFKITGIFENQKFKGGFILVDDQTATTKNLNTLKEKIYSLSLKNKTTSSANENSDHLNNFAHMCSHDMKEPLRMICNFAKLIEKRAGEHLDPVSKEYMQYVVGGAQNINTLITDLMSYIDTTQHEMRRQEIVMTDVFLLLKKDFHQEINELGVEFTMGLTPETIQADLGMIKTVFKNIIHNAIKFRNTEASTKISITGKDLGRFWQFSVEDNGIGIQEEYKEGIFELFKRLHSKQVYKGSGIGLSVAQEIVKKHNGKIWVESVLGQKSVFHFTISK